MRNALSLKIDREYLEKKRHTEPLAQTKVLIAKLSPQCSSVYL